MNLEDVHRKIGEVGIIPVVRAATFDEARRAVDAICAGGIPIVEITMTITEALAVIRKVANEYGNKVLTGAGTVLTAEQAKSCLDAGAQFLVSPGLSVPVLGIAKEYGTLAIPGALTPTEVMAACAEGARLVKIFPCGSVGGPKYLKALMAPFPGISFIPTGGVNLSNAGDYIAAGAFALGVGADLVDVIALRKGDLQNISRTARELVATVRHARDVTPST